MASFVTVTVSLVVTLCLCVAITAAVDCYSCDRISITDYNGADETGVNAAVDSVLSVAGKTNNAQCTDGSLTDSEKKTCSDGEVCYLLKSTFEMDFNSDAGTTTVSAEGEIHYCLASTERLPDIEYGCEDESHAEFTSAAANSIGLLTTSGSPFSNSASYDGQVCKCTTDLCNGNAADAAENRSGNGGASISRVYIAEVLFLSVLLLKWFM